MAYTAFFEKIVPIVVRVSFCLLFISLGIGQIVRFTLEGQGGGLLISDIASALLIVGVSILFLFGGLRGKVRYPLLALLAVAPFLVWSICVLFIQSSNLEYSNMAVALLYWVRLTSVLLLFPVGMVVIENYSQKIFLRQSFVYMYIALLILGFLQIIFFPTLEGVAGGWDPHRYRMVATWFDPNFFGAFLAIALPAAVLWVSEIVIPGLLRPAKLSSVVGTRDPDKWRGFRLGGRNDKVSKSYFSNIFFQTVLFVLALTAILLTKSRSTYVAVCVGLFVCGGVWLLSSSLPAVWKKVIIPAVISVLMLIGFAGVLLQERATNIFLRDPTIALRLEAYKEVWKRIVEPNIFVGVGYNAYQFTAQDAGLISNSLIHSRSGSDSSILTLLATTGVVGTALFLAPILFGVFWHVRRWVLARNYNSLLFIWATVVLLVHSQFEHSLLYPHVLIVYVLIALLSL